MEEKVGLRSLILEKFSKELLIEIYKLVKDWSVDNNNKRDILFDILNQYNIQYYPIGSGTNRYAALIDGYIFKFALDADGMIDNKREFKYCLPMQPYVIKTYEVLPDGLIAVCEYVELMTIDEFNDSRVRSKMRKILDDIGDSYFIGDIGIDAKNYTNWGWRKNTTRDLVILDYAYIYSTGFKTFRCTNCDAKPILFYDDNYTSLICPECNKVYSFATIRRRISKKDQEEEIGDILTQGYKLTHAREIQELNQNFSIRPQEEVKEKKKKKPVLTLNEPEEDEPELEIDD